MQRYVAMLRGINVGGHNRIAMPQLKQGFEQAGLENVATYLQSGNVVFDSGPLESRVLAESIRGMIKARFGHDVVVLVRAAGEMAGVVVGNPFLARQDVDPAKLHVTFLGDTPAPEFLAAVRPDAGGEDEWRASGRAIYLHCPNGYGRTKLNNTFFEQKLRAEATTRNWNTVLALRDMANAR